MFNTNNSDTGLGVRRSSALLFESDSELSDGEHLKIKKTKMRPVWKLQYQALLCLESFANQSPKQMHSQWTKFLPGSIDVTKSLMCILLHHSSDRVQTAVCRVLVAFFNNSKQYLSIAAHGYCVLSYLDLAPHPLHPFPNF